MQDIDALRKVIGDPLAQSGERIEALRSFLEACRGSFPNYGREVNNHIHTIYSFSPYTPAMAALKAREAALSVAGSVDHDSYAAAAEMRAACRLLGLGCVTGFEIRANCLNSKFGDRKLNSPDSKGILYMTVQGVPEGAADSCTDFLRPIVAERQKRNRLMVDKFNELTNGVLAPLSYDNDVVPLSKVGEGGTVTERHILFAVTKAFCKKWGRGAKLLASLERELGAVFHFAFSGKVRAFLEDEANPFYEYDLLGALKSAAGERIYIQPSPSECPPCEVVTAFARKIGALPAYAYLGDVGESPTGDKKPEKFEDDFLDDLFPFLKEAGFKAVTYMPPRNTKAQLMRVRDLCAKYGFMEISGVDINSPRQTFSCPELQDADFAHLVDTTWQLVKRERAN